MYRPVYVRSAKEQKARATERGEEVERLMALGGNPRLVDMSSHPPSAPTITPSSNLESRNLPVGQHNTSTFESSLKSGAEIAATGTMPSRVGERKDTRHNSGAGGTGCTRAYSSGQEKSKSKSCGDPNQRKGRIASTMTASASGGSMETINTSTPDSGVSRPESSQDISLRRVIGTASTPQLPCFSLGSRVSPREGRHGAAFTRIAYAGEGEGGGVHEARLSTPALSGLFPGDSLGAAPVGGLMRARAWTGGVTGNITGNITGNVAGSNPGENPGKTIDYDLPGMWLGSEIWREHAAEKEEATKTAVAAARGQADALLASHLCPFPTITKNRSLHAVSQPLVRHSQRFADACRGESSRAGTEAWRVARAARYGGLLAPADRLSIVRQIQAGLEMLQGAGVSPMA